MEQAKIPFESALEKLQLILKKMESGEQPLEESLRCYEEGVRLIKGCQDELREAELKVELLTGIGADGKPKTQPLSGE